MLEEMPKPGDESYDFNMRYYCDRHTFTFPIWYTQEVIPNMHKINPIKQVEVAKLYNIVQKYDFIKHAWIIGSACNPMCTMESDTDMIIETTVPSDEYPDYLSDAEWELHVATENGLNLLRLEELSTDEPISYEIYWRAQIK